MTTIIDLRLLYKKDTADPRTPITRDPFTDVSYVAWLEAKAVEGINLFHHCAGIAVSHPHLFPQFKVEKEKLTKLGKLSDKELHNANLRQANETP